MDFFKTLFQDDPEPPIWQLRDTRFDIQSSLEFLAYQKILGVVANVEDEKGNPRQQGILIVTNLRIIWHLAVSKQTNLSIGFDTIARVDKKVAFLRDNISKYTLCVKAGKGSVKYQFNFSSVIDSLPRISVLITKYYEKIIQTNNMRRLIIQATFLKNGRVDFLPGESHYMFNEGQGIEGVLYISNIRVVFQSNGKSQNFSLPWICILQIKLNTDDITPLIILKTRVNQGFYIKTKDGNKIFTQIKRLHQTYNQRPILGIQQAEQVFKKQIKQEGNLLNQDVEIVQARINILKPQKRGISYEVGKGEQKESNIQFCEQLGLAIQALPEGQNIQNLWRLLK